LAEVLGAGNFYRYTRKFDQWEMTQVAAVRTTVGMHHPLLAARWLLLLLLLLRVSKHSIEELELRTRKRE
jgi:hypothetical protein